MLKRMAKIVPVATNTGDATESPSAIEQLYKTSITPPPSTMVFAGPSTAPGGVSAPVAARRCSDRAKLQTATAPRG